MSPTPESPGTATRFPEALAVLAIIALATTATILPRCCPFLSR